MKRSDLPHQATTIDPDGREWLLIAGVGAPGFTRVDLPDGLPESMMASFEAHGGKTHPRTPMVAFVVMPEMLKSVPWETLEKLSEAESE